MPAKKVRILQKDSPILRKVSVPLRSSDIESGAVKKTIQNLKRAIDSQSDAVAISAVQIGKPIRLFLISKKIFDIEDGMEETKEERKDLVFINPKILKTSKKKQLLEEGCLSVRYIYGKVSRSEKASIEAFDENGKKFSRGFSGLLAQIVQHEIDHLNGVLFIDKAIDIQEVSPEEYEQCLRNNL